MKPHSSVFTLEQATYASHLGSLMHRLQQSNQYLYTLKTVVPAHLYTALQAGPIDSEEKEWCILVKGHGAHAKIRQLLPAMLAHLHSHGAHVVQIRLRTYP